VLHSRNLDYYNNPVVPATNILGPSITVSLQQPEYTLSNIGTP